MMSQTRSEIILEMAEALLSPPAAHERIEKLFRIAPNPTPHGRINQARDWRSSWADLTKSLIWC
jgi:hypothetical protein